MTGPTTHLTFDEPMRFVVPMIRAALTERPAEADVRWDDLPEVAVLFDCREQFGADGLNQLMVGLTVAAGAAVNMKALLLRTDSAALVKQFAAGAAVDHAVNDPGSDVMWEYVASVVHATISSDLTGRPDIEDVLVEVHRKHGTHGLYELLVRLAQFTARVLRDTGRDAGRERLLQLIGGRVDDFFAVHLRTAKNQCH